MRGCDPARPQRQPRADDVFGPEQVKAERYTNDVDDGIDRADFVELHVIGRSAVDCRLDLREPREHGACALHNA